MFPSGGWDYELLALGIAEFLSEPLPYSVVILLLTFHVIAFAQRSLAKIISR